MPDPAPMVLAFFLCRTAEVDGDLVTIERIEAGVHTRPVRVFFADFTAFLVVQQDPPARPCSARLYFVGLDAEPMSDEVAVVGLPAETRPIAMAIPVKLSTVNLRLGRHHAILEIDGARIAAAPLDLLPPVAG